MIVMNVICVIFLVLLAARYNAFKSYSTRTRQLKVGSSRGRLGRLYNIPPYTQKPVAELVCDNEGCFIEGGVIENSYINFDEEDQRLADYSTLLTVVPIVVPLSAFYFYDLFVGLYHDVITLGQTWYSVDGGELESTLLIPVVNGIVLPSISIVLGTLVSSTLTNLRNRQVAIRECLNREVADLTTLASATDAIFGRYSEDCSTRENILLFLRQYVERLILESRSVATASSKEALLSAKTGKNEMDLIQMELVNADASHRDVEKLGLFDDPFRWAIPGLIVGLNAQRSARLATLLTGYPFQHWLIIGLLYVSVILCFLEESDGAALQFLGGVQLRGLFTILVGGAAAMGSLLIDLNDPFRGNFCIKQTTDQLKQLLITLDGAILAGRQRQWVDTNPLLDAQENEIKAVGQGKMAAPVGEWLALDQEDEIVTPRQGGESQMEVPPDGDGR